MLIGISGKREVGKDTVADYLVEKYGFVKVPFALRLKYMARQHGWDGQKDDRGRKLLQTLGQVWRTYREDYWSEKVLKYYEGEDDKLVISDVRYFNEYVSVKNLGGLIWRLQGTPRPEFNIDIDLHNSETDLDKLDIPAKGWLVVEADEHIWNDKEKGFDELYKKVDSIMSALHYSTN